MASKHEMEAGREWARRLLGKPADAVAQEARRAEIRAEVEAELAEYDAQRRARTEREEGQRMAENALRHRRAAEQPRDVRPQEPVGTERHAHDGTVWVRRA